MEHSHGRKSRKLAGTLALILSASALGTLLSLTGCAGVAASGTGETVATGPLRERIQERREERRAGREAPAPSDLDRRTMRFEGLDRTYYLSLPDRSADSPHPLVVVLHGGRSNASSIARTTEFHRLGRREGFAVVYPEVASGQSVWNDGRDASDTGVNDVGFVLRLIDELKRTASIDSDRIYATGASNGGMFTQRLACEPGTPFAAVAPVVANLPADLEPHCNPGRPIPILMIMGTEDALMPYEGGVVARMIPLLGRGQGTVLSADATVRFWLRNNQCRGDREESMLPDSSPGDGTRIREARWRECARDAEVIQLSVIGGGHTWPGTSEEPTLERSGRISHDIDATQVIQRFFQRHSR